MQPDFQYGPAVAQRSRGDKPEEAGKSLQKTFKAPWKDTLRDMLYYTQKLNEVAEWSSDENLAVTPDILHTEWAGGTPTQGPLAATEIHSLLRLARTNELKNEDTENRLGQNNIRIVGLPENTEGRNPTVFVERWLVEGLSL